MAPALIASRSGGPDGNSTHCTREAERLELALERALALEEHQLAVFLETDVDDLVIGARQGDVRTENGGDGCCRRRA